MAGKKHENLSPAYVPWRTLMNFINGLRDTSLPSQINRSVMGSLSYSTQAQLLAGMRFLNLIDTDGKPSSMLAQLVDSSEKNQAEIIKKMLVERYTFVFDHLDLERATPDEVEKQFREIGITGSTVVRATGFFLSAAESAGILLSPHLKKKNGSPGGARRTRQRRKKPRSDDIPPLQNSHENQTGPPSRFEDQLLGKFPSFDPSWPDEIKKQWFAGFKQLMDMTPAKKGSA